MRYIRTKDGRIIDVSLFDEYQTNNEKGESVFDGFGNGDVYFPAEDILKQSDSIEELCDGFIAEGKGNEADWLGKNWLFISVEDFKDLSDEEKSFHGKNWDFYAFIKTSKGFIYVAKMNGKGEWESL